jgi:NAD(P)-dependent dehydrogenase (short-subunit alcohol dehydrogenase family)
MVWSDLFGLSGKKVLVTGASSGIGRATSILLSDMGAELVICGRDLERLNDTLSEMNNPELHQLFVGDLKYEQVILELVNSLSNIDGVVLIAGIVKTLPVKYINIDELSNILDINFSSPVLTIQKLIKARKINRGGSIIFMSSIAGNFLADKGNGVYAASKAALNGISKVMASEFSAQKIRVNSICPGMVHTPMTNNQLAAVSSEQLKLNESMYPLGYGTPQDVAAAVGYFLSDASKWVTGSSFVIDGGFTIV